MLGNDEMPTDIIDDRTLPAWADIFYRRIDIKTACLLLQTIIRSISQDPYTAVLRHPDHLETNDWLAHTGTRYFVWAAMAAPLFEITTSPHVEPIQLTGSSEYRAIPVVVDVFSNRFTIHLLDDNNYYNITEQSTLTAYRRPNGQESKIALSLSQTIHIVSRLIIFSTFISASEDEIKIENDNIVTEK